ncbi:unnamed protein product [marine sediment metagenome]|uniref:Uncharacterized protein n=1 Tax=marine sediment metagenome TaxID=412755 RepID=X1QXB4_9ZZZZ
MARPQTGLIPLDPSKAVEVPKVLKHKSPNVAYTTYEAVVV